MAERPATRKTPALSRVSLSKTRLTRQFVGRAIGEDVWQVLVDSTNRAVFVHDAQGIVQVVSAVAGDMFPGLVPGAQFAEVDGFTGVLESFELDRSGLHWRLALARNFDHAQLSHHGSASSTISPCHATW